MTKTLTKIGIGLFALLLIIATVFVVQQTAFSNDPTYIFTDTNHAYVYQGMLPQGKEATSYYFKLKFDKSASGSYTSYATADLLDTSYINPQVGESDYSFYLYGVPQAYHNFDIVRYKIRSQSTANINCIREDRQAEVTVDNYIVTKPYGDEIKYGFTGQEGLYLVISEGNTVKVNTGSSQHLTDTGTNRLRCYDTDGQSSGTLNIISESGLYVTDLSQQRFMIMIMDTKDWGANTATHTEPVVQIAVQKATYPTDVAYSIGGTNLDTLEGAQKVDKNTVDIAPYINAACNRDKNSNECNFQVTFTSTTPGKIWIADESTLKLMEDPEQSPECNDGVDNDNDGSIDYPDDTDCTSKTDNDESGSGGNGGEGLSLLTWFLIGSILALSGLIGFAVWSVKKGRKGKKKKGKRRKK